MFSESVEAVIQMYVVQRVMSAEPPRDQGFQPPGDLYICSVFVGFENHVEALLEVFLRCLLMQ